MLFGEKIKEISLLMHFKNVWKVADNLTPQQIVVAVAAAMVEHSAKYNLAQWYWPLRLIQYSGRYFVACMEVKRSFHGEKNQKKDKAKDAEPCMVWLSLF